MVEPLSNGLDYPAGKEAGFDGSVNGGSPDLAGRDDLALEVNTVIGEEEENRFKKVLFIPEDRALSKIELKKDGLILNFLYLSLTEDLQSDLEKVSSGDTSEPNSFVYATKLFSSSLNQVMAMFPHPEALRCFSGSYPINIFLAKDFDEICSVGNQKKQDLPPYVTGRVSGTTLIYTQDSFASNSKKYPSEIPTVRILGTAHELLHVYYKHNRLAKYENYKQALPFLFNEGLTVIGAKQISRDFADPFISPEQLFLENGASAFKYDKRWITENSYYQSAGHFMDYLLKIISGRESISYQEAFQKIFDTIGCPESLDDEGNFNSKKYMENVFGLDIVAEYNKFLLTKIT